MYFETAGIEVAPWILPLVALAVSCFTSTGGVQGRNETDQRFKKAGGKKI